MVDPTATALQTRAFTNSSQRLWSRREISQNETQNNIATATSDTTASSTSRPAPICANTVCRAITVMTVEHAGQARRRSGSGRRYWVAFDASR